ncbi:cadmium transporter [Bifidobacterium canis]|uniref:Cd efflux system component n=1 Tax=Bifidobacterium canis TaxID=2610880 RepID=A0A7K1J2W5_9BIFI|nr:cadmium transporter [Bifidobacterium canis]MUH58996.1 Cd efflux system component [Bifidobacterium canis]
MAATQQGSVTVHEKSGMPIMLTQAIIIAATLCVCELVCAPMYVGFIPNLFPLLPWALVAMLLAVAFTYIVGFALLWCAESFAYRMKRKAQPIVYSIIGAIAFAVWTIWVVLGIMNMIAGPATGQIVSKNNTVMAGINGGILGFASFFCASTLAERVAKYRKTLIVVGICTIVLAIGGGFVLASMLNAVHLTVS